MVLLQAAIAAGIFLASILALMLLVVVPILALYYRKLYLKRVLGDEYEAKHRSFKDAGSWLVAIVAAFFTVLFLFFLLVALLYKLVPSLGTAS